MIEAPRPSLLAARRDVRRRSRPGWLLLLGAVAGATLMFSVQRAGDSGFERRVASGCEELEPCRALEAEAERRMDACTFFCGGLAAQYREVRAQLHRAEERRAVRDHYRERERAERAGRELERAQKLDDWQRREAARAQSAAREHRERLELERLRQAGQERRLADERQRRMRYFASLGPEGRQSRLKRCLKTQGPCDALALELVESAADDAERRALGDLNEGVAAPAKPAEGRELELAVPAQRQAATPRGPAAAEDVSDGASPPSS